jgi:hypothetical protein
VVKLQVAQCNLYLSSATSWQQLWPQRIDTLPYIKHKGWVIQKGWAFCREVAKQHRLRSDTQESNALPAEVHITRSPNRSDKPDFHFAYVLDLLLQRDKFCWLKLD